MVGPSLTSRRACAMFVLPMALAFSLACGKEKKSSRSDEEDDPPSDRDQVASAEPAGGGDASKLTGTIGEKPLRLKTALVAGGSGRGIELVFSTHTPSCKEVRTGFRSIAKGEESFTVDVGPALQTDGTEVWSITRLSAHAFTKQGGELGTVTMTATDPEKGAKGELSFELDIPANEVFETPAQKLVVKGAFEAMGCGRKVPNGEPPPSPVPQPGLSVKVAGKSFAIGGAVVRPTTFPSDGHELLLTTGPKSCTHNASAGDLDLKLHIPPSRKVGFVYMAGEALATQLNASVTEAQATIVAKPAGPLEGEGHVEIELTGTMDVVGYKLSTEGKVKALRCPKQ